MSAYQNELNVGRDIARRAGELALRYREGGIGYECKGDDSPVTIADKECEKLIVSALSEAFPEDGLLGEEGAMRESTNGRKWIIDPIDGTRDFIRGTGAWSVLIGLEEHGVVVAGFAYFPARAEMFFASKGGGAWHAKDSADAPIQINISAIGTFSQALVCVNGLSLIKRHNYAFGKYLIDWLSGCWTTRSMGGCVDAMLVSSGRAEMWIEAQAQPWDLAPLKIIAEEAGAVTFDFAGRDTIYGGNFAISVPALATELKTFLATKDV